MNFVWNSTAQLSEDLSLSLENLRDRCRHLKHKQRRAIFKNFKRKFWRRRAAAARQRFEPTIVRQNRISATENGEIAYERQKNKWLRRELKFRLDFERRILEKKNRQELWLKAKKRIEKCRRLLNKRKTVRSIKEECEYFAISATCPLNSRCSKEHTIPQKSRLILLQNYFKHHVLRRKIILNDEDMENDWLENEGDENFCQPFVEKLLANFESSISKLYLCNNRRSDLIGNVYIEVENEGNCLGIYEFLKSEFKIDNVQFCDVDFSDECLNVCDKFRENQCCEDPNCKLLHFSKVYQTENKM